MAALYTDATPMTLGRWPDRRCLTALSMPPRCLAACVLVLLSVTAPSSAQSAQSVQTASPFDTATRAFNAGQYDSIDALLRGAADPRALALRARALVVRGRYADAEKLLSGPAASAPGSDAALELGILQMTLGRRNEATRTLQGVLSRGSQNSVQDLTRLGLAARTLDRFQEANGYFRAASAMAPDDPVVNAAWGELFLAKYNRADATKSFEAALAEDKDFVVAQVGLARTIAEENPPAARKAAEAALLVNPSYVPAHLLVAELALDDRRRDEARTSLGKALAVNPNSLEARALDASIALLEGRQAEFESKTAAILAINPVYGDAYRVAGAQLAQNYRFDEAVEQTRHALSIDPGNTHAYADLGLQLLRTGDEPGARAALDTAFKADPYDVVTFNLLTLLDTLSSFETIRDGDIVMRLHPDEAAVMREFAMPLAKLALTTLAKQYQFEPKGPILIEMFPKHDDFAVRTLGLPGMIGALGACFGRVVTLDSPRARPPGEFTWVGTLWHEVAHVITLQMSSNRMPRWLSEGISQFEEKRHRAEWGHEMEVPFAQALEAGKTLKIREINEGFSDPQTISLSYYQASLVVEHIIDTFGEPKLRDLLRAYGRGLENEDAITAALGVSIDQLQASFDAKIDKEFAALRAALKAPSIPRDATPEVLKALAASNPGSFRVQLQLGATLQEAGDFPGAIAAFERASALVPQANGTTNPNAAIAVIALKTGDKARAITALQAVLKVDYTDVEAARRLAPLLEKQGDAAGTLATYEAIAELDPFDGLAQRRVGLGALQRRDLPRAMATLRAALAAKPADMAGAHVDLGEAYFAAGRADDAKQQVLAALEIAPTFERAQDLLLKIVDARPAVTP